MKRTVAVVLLVLAQPVVAEGNSRKKIDAYLETCARFGFSGSVLIVHKGKTIVARGFGLADRKSKTPNGVDTLFEIASATKPFTACAIMKLVEMGKLGLEDPVGKHLPGVPESKRGITVRHLLSHTSGMPRSAAGGRGNDLENAVRGYFRGPLARPPGSGFEYWNGGYALLAGIIERVSGTSYTAFCREQLFQPAGLKAAGFTGDDGLPRQAIGYDGVHAVRPAAGHPYGDYGYQYRGMGGVVMSAKDLLRFLNALHAGRVLRPESVKLMETAVTKNYGLGWGMATTKRGTLRIGHGGDVRGFHMKVQRFPDEDATVIVMCNIEGIPIWTIAWNLEALLFGEEPPYPMPPQVIALENKALDRYVGRYVIDAENRIHVERAREGIRVSGDGLKACEILGAQPVADASVKTALRILEAVLRKDTAAIQEVLAARIPNRWPQMLIDRIWTKHVARWGEFRGMRTIGANAAGRGGDSVLVALQHERGNPRVRIVIQNGKLSIFDLKGPRFAVSRILQPVATDRFAAFAWMAFSPRMGPPPLGIRFDKDGENTVMVLHGKEGNPRRFTAETRKPPRGK